MSQFSSIITSTPSRKRPRSSSSMTQSKRKSGYTKGMKLYRSIKQHNFVRCASTQGGPTYPIDLYNGFATTLFDIQLSFAITQVNVSLGGTIWRTIGLPNNSEFTSLYDQYRIDWVECEFFFSANSSGTNDATYPLPIMYIVKDYDDSQSASVSALCQYNNVKTWQLGNQDSKNGKFVLRVKPNVDTLVFAGAISGYARSKPMFIDTTSNTVPHYGVKMAFDPITAPGASRIVGFLSMNFKYHLTMMNTR